MYLNILFTGIIKNIFRIISMIFHFPTHNFLLFDINLLSVILFCLLSTDF